MNMSTYESVWKILSDMITDFRRKGEEIPKQIMDDLRSAKTLIEVLKVKPGQIETAAKVECYLSSVESYLIITAKEKFGDKYVKNWVKKIEEAKVGLHEIEEKTETKFVPGLPRDKHWIRVRLDEDINVEEIRRIAESEGLSCELQKDGFLLISGNKDKVKSFVRRAAETLKSKKKKSA